MAQGQVFLKVEGGGGGGGDWHFSYLFSQGLSSLHLENNLPLAKLCYAFWRKVIFFCHHNFMKKGHCKLSKNEPENIPLIEITCL